MAFVVRFTPASEAHLYKHAAEDPEIQPHFVERILNEAEPQILYEDRVEGRYIFEGYLGCRPYRVVLEFAEEDGTLVVYPVSVHRIREKAFKRSLARMAGRLR